MDNFEYLNFDYYLEFVLNEKLGSDTCHKKQVGGNEERSYEIHSSFALISSKFSFWKRDVT